MRQFLLTIAVLFSASACKSTQPEINVKDTYGAPDIASDGMISLADDDHGASFVIERNLHLETTPDAHIFCDDSVYAQYLKDRFLSSDDTKKRFAGRRTNRQRKAVERSLENEAIHVARAQLNHPTFFVKVSGLPVEYNASVEKWLNYFTGPGRRSFLTWLVRAESVKGLIIPVLLENGLPPELTNMAMIESGFSNHAYSSASATGTWQFMSGTAKNYNLNLDHWVDERRDPVKSTVAAARLLIDLYKDFGSWYLAFAAYNAGPGKIRRAMRKSGYSTFWDIAKTSHIRLETKEYVPKFLAAYLISQNPKNFGFQVKGDPAFDLPTGKVTLNRAIRLSDVSNALNVPLVKLRKWNPEIRRDVTPPNRKNYSLRIPNHKIPLFASVAPTLPALKIKDIKMHTIRRGDTMIRLAQQYGVTRKLISSMNAQLRANRLIIGKKIAIPVPDVEVIR